MHNKKRILKNNGKTMCRWEPDPQFKKNRSRGYRPKKIFVRDVFSKIGAGGSLRGLGGVALQIFGVLYIHKPLPVGPRWHVWGLATFLKKIRADPASKKNWQGSNTANLAHGTKKGHLSKV